LSKQLPNGFILLEALISLSILTGCALILIQQQQQLLRQSEQAKERLAQSRIMYEEARVILRHDGATSHTVNYENQNYDIRYDPQNYHLWCKKGNEVLEVQLEN